MCFTNNADQLKIFRARIHPITVWKTGFVSEKTGWVTTKYSTYSSKENNRVEWIVGKVSKPHKICKPLPDRDMAHAGLYFYTSTELPEWDDDMVRATVEPKDIIGANVDGSIILAVAAKVTKAIVPNQRLVRLAWLKDRLAKAKSTDKYRTDRIEEWKLDYDERQEAMQQIKDELTQLEFPLISRLLQIAKKRGK